MISEPSNAVAQAVASPKSVHTTNPRIYRPFDRVPSELLSYILTLVWLSYSGNDSVDRFRFPSIPCMVNRYFNHTAISTPILWSYLRVSSVTKLPHIQERVKCRSGALALDLYMTFQYLTYKDARNMVDAIFIRGTRFRTITLSYPSPSILHIPVGVDFWDHLSSLNERPVHTIRFHIEAINALPPYVLPAFASSVLLLHISCYQLKWSQTSLPDNLKNLFIEESGYRSVSTAQIIRLLNNSPGSKSLHSLSLSRTSLEAVGTPIADICVLDLLEYFKLEGFYAWEAALLFSSIHTPNLRHLSMKRILGDEIPYPIDTAWKAVRFPRLQNITLQDFDGDVHRLAELISNLPSSIRCAEITGFDAIDALREPPSTTFCQQLHHLSAREIPLYILLPLVGARCGSLQELELRYETIVEAQQWLMGADIPAYLDTIKTRGAEVKISVDGDDPEADEPACFAVEDLFASSGTDRPARYSPPRS